MQPWTIAKDADRAEELQAVCTVALNLYRQIVILLAPVVPRLANDSAALFGSALSTWQQVHEPIVGRKLQPFAHLMARADARKVQALISQSAESTDEGAATAATTGAPVAPQRAPSTTKGSATAPEPAAPECSVDDFMKVDLRVAQVVSAEIVEGSRKLLRLRVSLGETERTVFAGIRAAYEPESLVGRLLVVVANLPARAMKGGLSEGLALAAGPGGSVVVLLSCYASAGWRARAPRCGR
jgi:methionyl-tRNA synthetase